MGIELKEKAGPAGLVFALAALVTAIGGLLQPRDDSVTRATYDVVAANIRALRRDVQANREDLHWLRDVVTLQPSATTSAPLAADAGAPTDGGDAGPLVAHGGYGFPASSPPRPVAMPRPKVSGGKKGTRSTELDEPLPPFEDIKQAAE